MDFFTKLKNAGANPQTINDGQYVVFEHEVDGTINLVVANAKTEENLLVVKKPVSSIKEAERGIEVTYADGENDVYLETGFWLSELAVPGMSFGNESQSSEDNAYENETDDYIIEGNRLILKYKGEYCLDPLPGDIPETFTEIEFPSGLEFLHPDIFQSCKYAKENVTKLDFSNAKDLDCIAETFNGFKKIEVVVLPKKVDSIALFENCPNLKEIHVLNLDFTKVPITKDRDKRIDVYVSNYAGKSLTRDFTEDIRTIYVPKECIAMLEEARDKHNLELDIKPLPKGYVFPKKPLSKPYGGNSPKPSVAKPNGAIQKKNVVKDSDTKQSVRETENRNGDIQAARIAELEAKQEARRAELEAKHAARRAELEAKQEARRAELEAKQAARRAEFEAKQEARKANQRVTFDAITRGVYPLTLGNVIKAIISLFLKG